MIVGSDNADAELRKLNWKTLFKIEINPYYTDFRHSSDVAVLTLEKPLVLTPEVNPICLPTFEKSEDTHKGATAIVAGWGMTETGKSSEKQLLHVRVPIISNKKCKTFYSWVKRLYVLGKFKNLFRYHSVSIFVHINQDLGTVQEILVAPSLFSMIKTGESQQMQCIDTESLFKHLVNKGRGLELFGNWDRLGQELGLEPSDWDSDLTLRHMVVGVCSFANTAGDCTSTPGGFARLTLSVLQWIRSVKVTKVFNRDV